MILSRLLVAGSLGVLGCLAQTGTPPTLTPTPTSLTFTYSIGAALPAAQSVSVRASSGTPSYSIAITGSNIQWLTVAPMSGALPANLTVRVNPTSLPVGSYPATIVMTANGVTNPLKIGVTLTVTAALPTLSLSATSLAFTAPPLQPAAQRFTMTTTGGPIPFTVASGAAWLVASPATGVVLPGAPVTVTVNVDATNLNASATAYDAKLTITASGVPATNKTQLVDCTFLVNSIKPVITSIWPQGVQVNTPQATVTIFGTGFYSASVIKVGTQVLPTTVIGTTAVMATIPPVLVTTPGTISFVVSNPPPGGDSTLINFTVTGTPAIQAVTNTASGLAGAISPGEIISLYGEGIGPATNYSMQSTMNPGYVDTTLGGYTVTIDSVPAPILFLSQNQVNVQVPYEVTQGVNKNIAVSNGTVAAAGVATITPNAPGIFSIDGSGIGQAAALNYSATNQAYSLNGSTTPAHAGDTVIFYLTGEGDYVNTIVLRTGLLVPPTLSPLPQMNPLPVVTIGGQQATVSFAGPVVGSLLGILQINAVVPAGTAAGTAVPVTVAIGSSSAQSGITIVVK